MPERATITNPYGPNTPSVQMDFPSYFPDELIRSKIRERYPNKVWPGQKREPTELSSKGFWRTFMDSYGDAWVQAEEDFTFGTTVLGMSDNETINLLEEEYQKWLESPDEQKAHSLMSAGFIGETFGSVSRDILVGLGTGTLAGMATVNPLVGIGVGGSTVASLQGVTAKGGSIRNTYIGERYKQDQIGTANLGAAYETARKVSNNDAQTAVGEAALATMVPVPGVGKGVFRVGSKIANELAFDAAVGASGSVLSDNYAEAQGVDRGDKLENAFRAGLQEIIGGGIPTIMRGATEWGKYVTAEKVIKDYIETKKEIVAEEERKLIEEESKATTPEEKTEIGERRKLIDILKKRLADISASAEAGDLAPAIAAYPTFAYNTLEFDWSKQPVKESEVPWSEEELKLASEKGIPPTRNFSYFEYGEDLKSGVEETVRVWRPEMYEKPGSPDWTKKRVYIPVYNEQGFITSFRWATKGEVSRLADQDKIPNIYSGNFIQNPDNPFQTMVQIEGDYYEVFQDGSISSVPIHRNVLNEIGSVDSENEGGQVSSKYNAPPDGHVRFQTSNRATIPAESDTVSERLTEEEIDTELDIPVVDFTFNVPKDTGPNAVRKLADQVRTLGNAKRLIALIRQRIQENLKSKTLVKKLKTELKRKITKVEKKILDIQTQYESGKIETKDFNKIIANLKNQLAILNSDANVSAEWVRATRLPSNNQKGLFLLLSNPENQDIGPYPQIGDDSKFLVDHRVSDKVRKHIDAEKELHYLRNLLDKLEIVQRQGFTGVVQKVSKKVVKKKITPQEAAEEIIANNLDQEGMHDLDGVDWLRILTADFLEGIPSLKELGLKIRAGFDPSKPVYRLPKLTDEAVSVGSKARKGHHLLHEAVEDRWGRFRGDMNTVMERVTKIRMLQWLIDPKNMKKYGYSLPAELTNIDTLKGKEKISTAKTTAGETIVGRPSTYTNILKRFEKIAKHLYKTKRSPAIVEVVDKFALSEAEKFSNLISDYYQQIRETFGTGFKEEDLTEGRRLIRELGDGLLSLGHADALYSNLFFNPGAVPRIFNGLVNLAVYMIKRGVKSVADFAKAIGSTLNSAVKLAWEDGLKGAYRSMYSVPWKVLKSVIEMITPSQTTIEKLTPDSVLEIVNSWWNSFVEKHSLEQYTEEGKMPAVKALIKRNFIDRYYDLASIMAKVGGGVTGKNVEQVIADLDDPINTYYKLDALETLLGTKMSQFNDFRKRFFDTMREYNVDPIDFEKFLYAKHAPSRNEKIAEINPAFQDYREGKGGSGINNREAQEILDRIQAEGNTETYQKVADEFIYSVTANTLDIQLEGGLIDVASYERMKVFYENYIPLRGKEDSDRIMEWTGNGIEVRGPESLRAMGRESEAQNITAYVFQQHANAMIRAERNKVMQSLAAFIKEHPNDEIQLGKRDYVRKLTKLFDDQEIVTWVSNPLWNRANDIVAFKVDGKAKYLRFKNIALAHELRNSGVSSIKTYTRGVGKYTRILSKLNTQYNPAFIIPNFIRDIQYAKLNLSAIQSEELAKKLANIWNLPALISPVGKKKQGVVWDAWRATMRAANPLGKTADLLAERMKNLESKNPEAAKVAAEWDAVHKEMEEYAGKIAFYGINTFETQAKELETLAKEFNALNVEDKTKKIISPKVRKKAKQITDFVGNLLEGWNSGFENAARLATYKVVRDAGLSPQKAAYMSRNITVNFTKKGVYGSALNNLFMFYNAGIQGSYNIYKVLKHTEAGKKIFFNIALAGFLMEMYNQFLSDEDEEGIPYYDKIPEWKRKNHMIIMNPVTGKNALSIPLPYGYNVIHYAGSKIFQVGRDAYLRNLGLATSLTPGQTPYYTPAPVPGGMKPIEAALNIMSAAQQAFNPIGGDTSIARAVMPDIFDPIIDLTANRDWKGDAIWPEPSPFAPYDTPNSYRYWHTVGIPFKEIAPLLNKLPIISGGNEVISGHLDFSPEAFEHLTEHFTGGAGQFALRVMDLFTPSKWPPKFNDIPIARRFTSAPSSFYELEMFKELRAKSYQAIDLKALYLDNGEREKATQHQKLNTVLFKIHPTIKRTEGIIRKTNKLMRKISASKGLTSQEKIVKLRLLKQRKNEAMRKTHSRFLEIADTN